MGLFKNKIVAILLCIAIFLTAFYSVFAITGRTSLLGNVVSTVATPFRYCFSVVGRALGGFGDYFTEFNRLKDENKELSDRLAELEKNTAHVQTLEGENEWLRGFLGVSEELRDCTLIDALVIGRESNSYRTVYILNKGALSGVKVDMAVVVGEGLVGRVESVTLDSCKVSTIIESTSAVGAVSARSGARGIVEGSLGLRSEGYCSVEHIGESADIKVGDIMVSSGSGSVFPQGFIIGTVTEITPNKHNHTVSAKVKPAVDFDNVTRVMIVKKSEITTVDPTEADSAESE